jgi:YVTN family beta-propeller protein
MYDGWGRKFRYAVDASITATDAFPGVPLGCVAGAVNVCDAAGLSSGVCVNARSSGAIYALISHGPNGHGAYTSNGSIINANSANANELVNAHQSSAGVAAAYTPYYVQQQPAYDAATNLGNTTHYFDDIVTYKERWQMQTPWDPLGPCPPSLYVTNSWAGTVSVINSNTKKVIKTISLSGKMNCPNGPVMFSIPGYVYIPSYCLSGNVGLINDNNNTVSGPAGLNLWAITGNVLVNSTNDYMTSTTCLWAGTYVCHVNLATNTAYDLTSPPGMSGWGMSLPVIVGTTLYAMDAHNNNLYQINTTTDTFNPTPLTVGTSSGGQDAIAYANGHLYITENTGNIYVVDTSTFTLDAASPIVAGSNNSQLLVSGNYLYVLGGGGVVVEINTTNNTVVSTLTTAGSAPGVIYNGYLYTEDWNAYYTINLSTFTKVNGRQFFSGGANTPYVWYPYNGYIYIVFSGSNQVQVLNTSSDTITQTISVGSNPNGIIVGQ